MTLEQESQSLWVVVCTGEEFVNGTEVYGPYSSEIAANRHAEELGKVYVTQTLPLYRLVESA